jgi:hypothetical protein
MGLDQYAYCAMKSGESDEYWGGAELDETTGEFIHPTVSKPREIAYWRKHPNLHGWMYRLWVEKGNTGAFNGDELELTWEDLDRLKSDIENGTMAQLNTTGFFFGNPSDSHYREQDLEFVYKAKAEIFCGFKVFYNSSW